MKTNQNATSFRVAEQRIKEYISWDKCQNDVNREYLFQPLNGLCVMLRLLFLPVTLTEHILLCCNEHNSNCLQASALREGPYLTHSFYPTYSFKAEEEDNTDHQCIDANFALSEGRFVRKCKLIAWAIVASFMCTEWNITNLTGVHLALQESSTHHVVSNGPSVHRGLVAHLGVNDFHQCLLQRGRHLSWVTEEHRIILQHRR